jgi:hypothetical protein
MKGYELERAIEQLWAYFLVSLPNAKIVSEKAAAAYPMLETLPSSLLPELVMVIQETEQGFPRNIGKAFRSAYQMWRNEHPERVATETKQDCAECGSRGLIWIERYYPPPDARPDADGSWYGEVARCKRCRNWTRHFNSPGLADGTMELTLDDVERNPNMRLQPCSKPAPR